MYNWYTSIIDSIKYNKTIIRQTIYFIISMYVNCAFLNTHTVMMNP